MNNTQTRLGQILQAQGLTQKELADRTGLSVSMINRLVSGQRSGRVNTWFMIAKALNVRIDDLVYIGGDHNAQT